MDLDDNDNRIRIKAYMPLALLVALAIFLGSLGAYYFYSANKIPERLAASDQTMLMTDSMRHTFKVNVLNLRAIEAYLLALREKDEVLVSEAIRYMKASLGFIFSDYIDNQSLASQIAPLIRENIALVETYGLGIADDELSRLKTNLQRIYWEVEQQEKQIWISFQREFVRFQSNEYRLQLIYQLVIVIALTFLIVTALFLHKQRALNRVITRNEHRLKELISERGAQMQAIKENETRYRAIFAQQFQFMIIVSPAGTILDINELPLRVTGYKREEFIGAPFWGAPAWKNLVGWQEKWTERLKQAAATNVPVAGEDIYQLADGSIRNADSSTTTIRDETNKLLFYLIQASDTTERRRSEHERNRLLRDIQQLNDRLEQRVRERTSELEAVNKELEAFSYSVSHDLRSPLRAIDGFSLALAEDYEDKLDGSALDYLRRVRNAAQRMGVLIDELLQLSRVNRGALEVSEVDLHEMAQAVLDELRAADPLRQVEFRVDPVMKVQGDRHLLRIVLDNLLGNAWKFTAKETVSRVTFGQHPDKTGVFCVQDNGVGFDMRHEDKLFGAFQRLHRVADFPGTGVGLATVQRIIHRHGGRIWAESQVGKGAAFYFVLEQAASHNEGQLHKGEKHGTAEKSPAG